MPRAFRPGPLVCALACLVVAFALGSCGGDSVTQPNLGPYGSIVITSPSDTATIKSTLPFSATVTDTSGNPVSAPVVSWQSSDPSVAVINTHGELTPKVEGLTTVRAVGGGATSNPIDVVVIQDFGWVDQSASALTLADLGGVHFVDALHGWAVGTAGTIIATKDAGLTWSRQNSNSTGYTLNSVFFVGPSHGFVVGSAGRILETTDAGFTWDVRTGIDTDNGANLRDITFYDNRHGFIVGNAGIILRTNDAGATWTRLLPGVTNADLLSVSATTQPGPDTTAWAVGSGGIIVGTEDAGATWQIAPTPFIGDATGVVRRTRDVAFAVGVNNITATTVSTPTEPDWILAPLPPSFTEFYGLAWPSTVQLVSVGETTGGTPTILRSVSQGDTWIVQDLPTSAVISGHGLRDVWFVDQNRGWAVGRLGTIVHTATGGKP